MRKKIILLTLLMLFIVFLSLQEIIQNPKKPLSSNAGRILEVEEMFRITDESGDFFIKYDPMNAKIILMNQEGG